MAEDIWSIPLKEMPLTDALNAGGYPKGVYRIAYYVDGKLAMTLRGGAGKWNQSEVVLPLNAREAAEHTILIKVTEKGKKFTITAIAVK